MAKYPSEKELAKRLGTDVRTFHRSIKPDIIKAVSRKHAKAVRAAGSKNFRIGVTSSGKLVLMGEKSKKEIETQIPLADFAVPSS